MNEWVPSIAWPPEYKVKRHRRARSVKLRTAKPHGLEITVPYRFSLRELPEIIEENKVWITKQLLLLQAELVTELPTQIILSAFAETWTVHYVACQTKLNIIQRPHYEIVLVGKVADKELCKKKLIHWLKQQAKERLIERLQQLSEMTQLFFESAGVRDQDTLWGSCTAKQSISLNYKLIFLPPHLMTHVMIHELCHTKHLNHSERFWRLVEKYDPNWQEHRRALRRGNQFVPKWL